MRSGAVARCAVVAAALLGLTACSGRPGAVPATGTSTRTDSPAPTSSAPPSSAPPDSSGTGRPGRPTSSSPARRRRTLPGRRGAVARPVLAGVGARHRFPVTRAAIPASTSATSATSAPAAWRRGNFAEARETFADDSSGGPAIVSLYWIPAHAADLAGLTVTGTQIERRRRLVRRRADQSASSPRSGATTSSTSRTPRPGVGASPRPPARTPAASRSSSAADDTGSALTAAFAVPFSRPLRGARTSARASRGGRCRRGN